MPGRIASSTLQYEEGIGKKCAEGLQFLSTFVGGIVIALYYNVYIACVVFGCMPLIAVTGKVLVDVNSDAAEFATTGQFSPSLSLL